MIAKVFAVALTLTATVDADNCAQLNSALTLKADANLSTTYCGGISTDECTMSKCDCLNCCTAKPETCAKESEKGTSCGKDKEFDRAKMATTFTSGDTFTDKCCKTVNPTCATQMQMCDTGKVFDMAQKDTAVTKDDAADWKKKCCADAPKCSADACTGKAGYKGAKNGSTSMNCSSKPCTTSACCELDSTKCLHVSMSNSCDTSKNSVMPESKHGEAATAADFQAKCCTVTLPKCTDFKAATLKKAGGASTSGTKQQHAGVTLSLLFAVIGGLVMA